MSDRVAESGPVEPTASGTGPSWRLAQPTPGLNLALDPRIPDELEAFPLEVVGEGVPKRIEWLVDGVRVAETGPEQRRFLWSLARGRHEAQARVWTTDAPEPFETPTVAYHVR